MKISLVSFYYEERLKYPAKHSLHAERLAAYVKKHIPNVEIRLSAFEMKEGDQQIAQALLAEDADIVALPGYMWTSEKSKTIGQYIEQNSDKPIIVAGGPDVTTFDFRPWSDRCLFVAGQGEEPFLWICNQRNKNPRFNGASLSSTDAYPVFSKDFDPQQMRKRVERMSKVTNLPEGIPLYSDEMLEMYNELPGKEFVWQETARGCVYRCSFCAHKTLAQFATYSTDLVREELKNMAAYGIRGAFYNDPIIGGQPARGKEMLRMFHEYLPNMKQMLYVRPEFLDQEFVDLLANLDTEEVHVGIQTINPNVPKHVRTNDLEKIRQFVPQLSKKGIKWRGELLTGLPGDNLEGLQGSFRFVIDELSPTYLMAYHLSVLPQTKLETLVDKFDDPNWLKIDHNTRRVVASSSAGEDEIRKMLSYSFAMCSLYISYKEAQLKGLHNKPILFDDLHKKVMAAIPEMNPEELDTIHRVTITYPATNDVWKKHGVNPLCP